MQVDFTPELRTKLRAAGYELTLNGNTRLLPSFSLERPCVIHSAIVTDHPFSMGAFSASYGGRLRAMIIGRYCSMAAGIETGWDGHPTTWGTSSMVGYVDNIHNWATLVGRPDIKPSLSFDSLGGITEIGNDVWIGHGVFIKPGVKIGDGAVIGSRAVVTQDIPPYAIAGGVPARIIRYRFDEQTIQRLIGLRWWDYNIYDLPLGNLDDISAFIDSVQGLREAKSIELYCPPRLNAEALSSIIENSIEKSV